MKRKIFILTALVMMIFCVNACAFSDVQIGSWYYDNVTDMTNQGYLSGYEDGTFRPDGTVTKAEFVSIVGRIAGLQESAKQNNHWADGMVKTALTKGLFDWDEIPPTAQTYDEPITRQLAVKIVMNAFFKDERGDYNRESSSVSDFAQLDGRYYDSMIAAYCKGIVYGDDKGSLNPKSSITRAEACAIIMRAASMKGDLKLYEPTVTEQSKPQTTRKGGVSENGALHVVGTQLMNENNEPVVLHGMSSHGLQWFGDFATENAVKATADYGANLFRCAMYTDEGGYISNPSVKDTLINAVDSAIRQDMYVIIDWHILSDGNPMQHIDDAVDFFAAIPKIARKVQTIKDVGLGYVTLGQPATTLSGGEAQRMKLASELHKRSTGKSFYILDEPTTGLHTDDIARLLKVLQRFVDDGNTVLVIEHNLDVIKTADHIIDLGPEGGVGGGTIVATGTPEEVVAVPESYSGQYLKEKLT